jgi:dihydrodipicolinate synthase/N-acetylneuraminate lyase
MTEPIKGVLGASVTPLTDGGNRLDEAAFGPLIDFMAGAGLDGLLAMGTTGEGILLDVPERQRATDLFVKGATGRLKVIVNAGAQTTLATANLAAHAATAGADGVAVIAPPYFLLDRRSIVDHFVRAAKASAPLPFYIYEFADRSGYPVPPDAIAEIRDRCPNLAGLKVSDAPWERFEPYLIEGLSIFVGPETLIDRGMAAGAVGAVSALASTLPELVIEAVRSGTPQASARCGQVRNSIQRYPFHSALKRILRLRGVPLSDEVRPPLRRVPDSDWNTFDSFARDLLNDVGIRPLATQSN